jgi:hypothetical protein
VAALKIRICSPMTRPAAPTSCDLVRVFPPFTSAWKELSELRARE